MRPGRVAAVSAGVTRWALRAAAAAMLGGCDAATSVPAPVPPGLIVAVAPLDSVTVGANAGVFTVTVTRAGIPVPGVSVSFTVTQGSGVLGAVRNTTDANGQASTTFRAGTAPGVNRVTAFVSGATPVAVSVVGVPGPPASIEFNLSRVRFSPTQDSALVTATVRDTYLNIITAPIVWASRNPSLVTATPAFTRSAVARAVSRPGSTWIVATSGAATDSILVAATDSASTPCSFLAAPVTLAVGASLEVPGDMACIRATTPDATFAVIAHFSTSVAVVSQSIQVVGEGVSTPTTGFPATAAGSGSTGGAEPAPAAIEFERALRSRERLEIGPRVEGARAWHAGRAAALTAAGGPAASAIGAAMKVGDLVSLNVNAFDFCGSPDARQARVAAVTGGTIVMADVDNPANGFTDEEYHAFARMMDTLVHPVDTAAFGAPTDLDGNGRVGIFFTRAVNELTSEGSSGGVILGFYYLRDLLPRLSAAGACPGSNVGEMFYLLVPDPDGEVNNNPRSKAFVAGNVVGTIAHEYQHLINASRRMYVTNALRVDEDVWLNEGLSHIAEELVFYRASGLSPRANLTAAQLSSPATLEAFDLLARTNLLRYREHLRQPETASPMGGSDGIGQRGAAWSFLRYVADRVGPTDADLWLRLVNARTTGAVNLSSALANAGVSLLTLLKDWSVSVLADDSPVSAPAYQQSSWNFIDIMGTMGGSLSYTLNPRVMLSNVTNSAGLLGGGSTYLRFAVAANREALIRAAALGGAPLPPGIQLTIVRLK